MLNRKEKRKYMKKYNKMYQRALGMLRTAHAYEFGEILAKLMHTRDGN